MFDAVCAGHICIDLTPNIPARENGIADIFVGGKLTNVGDLKFSTGGSVSNTGIALNRLGINTPLIGKIGDDMLGRAIKDMVMAQGGNADYLKTAPGEGSSYSIVIAIPGVDRIFLHNPGTNDTFGVDDIDFELIADARLMHFGYPTLMKGFFQNNGVNLYEILRRAKAAGATTSLDMSLPDPSSESGKADWPAILADCLPLTDIFMPSIEEIIFMLDRPKYSELKSKNSDILKSIEIDYISDLGERIIGMGSKVAVLKCGTLGYYIKTAPLAKLKQMGRALPGNAGEWSDAELFSGIYKVTDFKSATGAGDTSIAGFLAAFLGGFTPAQAINLACATGAICVTSFGAVDAIIPLDRILDKIHAGWEKLPVAYDGSKFKYDPEDDLYKKI